MLFFFLNVIVLILHFTQCVFNERISTIYCLIFPLMTSHFSFFAHVLPCVEESNHVPNDSSLLLGIYNHAK